MMSDWVVAMDPAWEVTETEAGGSIYRMRDYFPKVSASRGGIKYIEWVDEKHEGPRWFVGAEDA
jgi:hypothetical protein